MNATIKFDFAPIIEEVLTILARRGVTVVAKEASYLVDGYLVHVDRSSCRPVHLIVRAYATHAFARRFAHRNDGTFNAPGIADAMQEAAAQLKAYNEAYEARCTKQAANTAAMRNHADDVAVIIHGRDVGTFGNAYKGRPTCIATPYGIDVAFARLTAQQARELINYAERIGIVNASTVKVSS